MLVYFFLNFWPLSNVITDYILAYVIMSVRILGSEFSGGDDGVMIL